MCQPNSACPVMREEIGLRCPGNIWAPWWCPAPPCFLAAALLLCCFTACGAFPGTSSLAPRQTKAASWGCVWRRGAPQAVCRARRAPTGGTAGQRERLRRPLLAICGKHGPGKGRCLGYSDMPKVSVVGVFGCTGSGKSTICEALAAKVGPDATEIIHGDAFFLPPHLCPPLDGQLALGGRQGNSRSPCAEEKRHQSSRCHRLGSLRGQGRRKHRFRRTARSSFTPRRFPPPSAGRGGDAPAIWALYLCR